MSAVHVRACSRASLHSVCLKKKEVIRVVMAPGGYGDCWLVLDHSFYHPLFRPHPHDYDIPIQATPVC